MASQDNGNERKIRVAVVILNWNGEHFLRKFLPSVVKYNAGFADIIMADNASVDGSVSFIRNEYPEIRIIQNGENGGFAKGYNQALSQIDADYYVLLNSDIEVTDQWIEPVIDMMEKDVTIAAAQPKILSYHEPQKFEYAGAAGGYIDQYGYPFCRGRVFMSVEKDTGQYNDPVEIFWATGACMFVRAGLFHEAGGLDDDFFAHMEEIDLCWRFKHMGYKIMYCPESRVYHVGGGSLPRTSSKKTYLNFRNNATMLYKNLPASQLTRVFIVRFILDLAAALKFLIEGHGMSFIAVTRAHIGFYFSYHKNRKKRELIKHSQVPGIYKGNLVLDHYVFRKHRFTQFSKQKFTR